MSIIPLILLLFAATAGLRVLAERSNVPLPTLLVLGGLAIAVVPALPRLNLDPEAVFLIFIPPLLYWTALTTSWRELRRNLRAITMLAVVLVLGTMAIVAWVTHALIPDLPLAMCFVLGAIVSPPDAVAVTASTRNLSLPRNLVAILEGESLANDATALIAYQVALAAAVTGSFSLPKASLELLLAAAGGIAIGLGTGWCVGWVRRHMDRFSVVENTLSLLCPFIAFIPAHLAGCSGILAVVAMGLYLGRRSPRVVTAQTRLQGVAMWEVLTFLLEGLIFIFIGLELPEVVEGLQPGEAARLTWVALAVSAAMIATRVAFTFPGAYLPRWIDHHLRHRPTPYPSWRNVLFTGWAGIRGGDSLVIALALPYLGANGSQLAGRNVVIFITFGVILVTLVVQGFTLAPAIRLLGLAGGTEEETEERHARTGAIQAGMKALDQFEAQGGTVGNAAAELRETAPSLAQAPTETARADLLEMRLAVIAAQRESVIAMRDRDEISDKVMNRLQLEFDHEEVLLRERYGEHAARPTLPP
jgi:CPA1 family monovalent cation:H+ antiporter